MNDIMSQLNYAICAEIALLLFFFAFLAVIYRTLHSHPKSIDQQSRLPLEEGTRSQHHE